MTDNRNYKDIPKEELINIFEEAGSTGFSIGLLLGELDISLGRVDNTYINFFHPDGVSQKECEYAYKKGQLNSIRKIYKAILEKAILGDLDSVEFLKKETVLFQISFKPS